ncbi:hypothetical protein BaRGS_00033879 [Batillaria attramentaria]|uniref:Uncharacterized protein n=1 Tax=Batillaria attramentaria TaxID=370345 RepID=A0ABD0JIN9_9CAEN
MFGCTKKEMPKKSSAQIKECHVTQTSLESQQHQQKRRHKTIAFNSSVRVLTIEIKHTSKKQADLGQYQSYVTSVVSSLMHDSLTGIRSN